MAKSWFESEFGKSKIISPRTTQTASFAGDTTVGDFYFNETYQITPTWTQSEISAYLSFYPIVVVPIQPIAFLDARQQNYSLIVFRDSANHINARLQVYTPYPQYKQAHPIFSVSNFSGLFYQICLDGKVERIFEFQNGQFTGKITLTPDANFGRNIATNRGICDMCNNNNPVGLDNFICAICHAFRSGGRKGDGGGPGGLTGESSTNTVGAFGFGNNIPYGSSNGNGNGNAFGNGNSNLGNQIDNTIFTTTQLIGKLQNLGFDQGERGMLLDNMQLKGKIISYFSRRNRLMDDVAIAAALKNNISYADNQPDLLMSYLDLLTNNDDAFGANLAANFPLKRYIDVGFLFAEFSDLSSNQILFAKSEAFLNVYGSRSDLKQRIQHIMVPTVNVSGLPILRAEKIARFETFIDITNNIKTELSQFSQQIDATITSGGDMNLLMRIFGKILGKKIGKVIPFVGTALGADAAWTAYSLGNYWEAAFELAGVAMDFIPAGVALETGYTVVGVAYDAFKAYKPISKISGYCTGAFADVFTGLFKTIDELNLLDKLGDITTGNSVTNIRVNLSNAGKTVDDCLDNLALALGKTWDLYPGGAKRIDL
jgi:hypothetical protein